MATTAIFPIKVGSRRSVAKALKGVIDYMDNPLKTDLGEYVSSYECTPGIADMEFYLSKQRYYTLTNRSQGKKDVIAYHARQSFSPGEITPEEANRLGYELALRFTKGRNSFIVCTHIDRAHVHNHIVWNSTNLDCKGKFRNFIGSAFALRRCSDIICAENGLSVIKEPQPSLGKDYVKHVYGKSKPLTFQDRIRNAIDDALSKNPKTFEDFIKLIEAEGITTKRRGKHMRLWMPDQEQPTRLSTLKGNHTEEVIRERIAGRRVGSHSSNIATVSSKPNLLIDIQAKLKEGKGEGYAHWASVQNLKQMAKTLIYLQEQGLDDFNVLKEKAKAASTRFNELSDTIKDLDTKLTANTNLQKQIVTYSKTRATYAEYRKTGYSKSFRATNETDILLHQTAKKTFDELGYGKGKKIPKVAELRTEYAPILEEKKRAYKEYRQAKIEMQELVTAKVNVERFLNLGGHTPGLETEKTQLQQ